jgi:hypothetical protein
MVERSPMPGQFITRRTSNLRRSITGRRRGGNALELESALTDRILQAVSKTPGCRIEDVIGLFPDLTWNRIFRELGRLSRNRQVRLVVNRRGITLREC